METIERWDDVNGDTAIGVTMVLEKMIRCLPGVNLIHDGSEPTLRFGSVVASDQVYTRIYEVTGTLVEMDIFKPGAKIKFVYDMPHRKSWIKIGVSSINNGAINKDREKVIR